MTNDLLVIKVNTILKTKEFSELAERLIQMRKEGVLVLPFYCDAIMIPDDVNIQVESEYLN